MDHHLIITTLLLIVSFLGLITTVQWVSHKTSFPYTVALLIIGLVTQLVVHALPLHLEITLPPEVIYFVLLPILLFEAALHINLHQFRLQFKTITFLATFGVMSSMFVTATLLWTIIGLPFQVALLFGALISATDPIAVLALFKTLGAPKRLSLLADGESMFNDATAVIAFRIISGFVIADNAFGTQALFSGLGDFLYIFIGSLIVGGLMGIIWAYVLVWVKKYPVLVNVLSIVLGLGSFVVAEHFFHLSGVIATVAAGITMGNFVRTKIHTHSRHLMEHFWEILGFVALSIVFFMAAYTLDLRIFTQNNLQFFIVIGSILAARAISVYLSFGITNRLAFFKNEPNVPMSWQHVLNWGGLRGVIPLVLVYSLPDSFIWKQHLLGYTLVSLLFTIIFNGLTIKSLLMKLGLHLPKKEEQLIQEEQQLFALEEVEEVVAQVDRNEFDDQIVNEVVKNLQKKERQIQRSILNSTTAKELKTSLQIQAINIERDTIDELYHAGYLGEAVYYQFDTELDLQQDALEYPEVFSGRGYEAGGFVHSRDSYRSKLLYLTSLVASYKSFRKYFQETQTQEIANRYILLRARVISSQQVIIYLKKMAKLAKKQSHHHVIEEILAYHQHLIHTNTKELRQIEKESAQLIQDIQRRLLSQMVANHPNVA